ncbi:flagellar protein FlgN [Shewanella waksmanii]|uniref:flagellar protein FlgN n=1 Tax=Shewanella waksmanii TaxID=213783 RepID=UPI0004915792|nr:flagellar protein FlgN [Shewanella waksmanii]
MDKLTVNKREVLQSLVRGIRQDIDGYKQLKSLLKQQRELMQRRDNQGLSHHNEHQTALCDELMLRAKARCQFLNQLGFSGDAQGMALLLEKLPAQHKEQLSLWWQNLLAAVKESQAMNDANGKLLVTQQAVIASILQQEDTGVNDYGEGLR